jgi:hypothetical protein
MEGLFAMN